MKKHFLLALVALLISVLGFSQVKTSEFANTGDTVQRIITNRNAQGISKLGLFTGSNAVWFRADDGSLNIIADSLFYNGIVLCDTNQIKEVDTATDLYDVVPFFQILDSISAGGINGEIKFDTIIIDSHALFTCVVSFDTNRITLIDTATDPYDAVPFWQIMDSIIAAGGGSSGSSFWSRDTTFSKRLYPANIEDSVGIGTAYPTSIFEVFGEMTITNANHNLVIGHDIEMGGSYGFAVGRNIGGPNWTGNGNVFFGERIANEISSGTQNTAVGYYTFASTSLNVATASYNVAIGHYAMQDIESGSSNVGIGVGTLSSATTAKENTAIGRAAMYDLTTGSDNVAIGYLSLANAITSVQCTSIGSETQSGAAATGSYNTSVGYQALKQPSGAGNTAVGWRAGDNNGAGQFNTYLGYNAGDDNWTGSYNILIGYKAMANTAVVSHNIGIGYYNGYGNKYGGENVFIGNQSGYTGDTSLRCVFIGHKAGYKGDSEDNTFIGYQAGYDNATGDRNIAIGSDVGVGIDVSDTLNIGNVIQANLADKIVYVNDVINLVPRPAAPSTAFLGMLYSNSTDTHLYYYNGTAWVQLD